MDIAFNNNFNLYLVHMILQLKLFLIFKLLGNFI